MSDDRTVDLSKPLDEGDRIFFAMNKLIVEITSLESDLDNRRRRLSSLNAQLNAIHVVEKEARNRGPRKDVE